MIEKNYIAELSKGVCSDAKAKIINAAVEEFALLPFSAARTRQIAEKAGVNHAAISYYFGGKRELYLETVRQLAEFIHMYMAEHLVRGSEIEKSKSAAEAKRLIVDFVMSRVCVDSKTDPLLRRVIMILTREEMYPTKAFDTIYAQLLYPASTRLEKLVLICKPACPPEDAKILAQMLIGQIMLFNSARLGFKRVSGWSSFGEEQYAKIESVFSRSLEKILS